MNKGGNIILFSFIEKSIICPLLISSWVLIGSNNVSSFGIPTISSVLLNLKDLYSFSGSNPVILQLKSAWSCSSTGFTDSSSVHFASDKVGSIVPS